MKGRVVTLWGEEILPEVAPVVKARGKADEEESAETGQPTEDAPKRRARKTKEAGETTETEIALTVTVKEEKEPASKLELPAGWEKDKKYYSIGEVAELFKIKTSHIRFWTNEFAIRVRTTRKGDRLYTEDQIREIKAIYHLVKERGFTLTGAKAKLKEQNKREVESVDLRGSLIQLKNKLLAIREKL